MQLQAKVYDEAGMTPADEPDDEEVETDIETEDDAVSEGAES